MEVGRDLGMGRSLSRVPSFTAWVSSVTLLILMLFAFELILGLSFYQICSFSVDEVISFQQVRSPACRDRDDVRMKPSHLPTLTER